MSDKKVGGVKRWEEEREREAKRDGRGLGGREGGGEAARQTARGRWRRRRKPGHEYGGMPRSPTGQTGDLASVHCLMKTYGISVCASVCKCAPG